MEENDSIAREEILLLPGKPFSQMKGDDKEDLARLLGIRP